MPKTVSPLTTEKRPAISIAAVERDTGLLKDTLRVWERRYGFPRPLRDENGERLYPADQLERLQLIRRLIDRGERPGKIVGLPAAALRKLGASTAPSIEHNAAQLAELNACLRHVQQHDTAQLRSSLHAALLTLGLMRFTTEVVAPLNGLIGEAWMRGEIQIFEEHFYTENVTLLLRQAIAHARATQQAIAPRVLLTTIPKEGHGLGLLMAESLLTLESCDCISLGVQTPISQIIAAAQAQQVNIVALSFSTNLTDKQIVEPLTELRIRLPKTVEIWAGGAHAALRQKVLPGITTVPSLNDIKPMLAQWRKQHPSAEATTG